jgi:hypothetical protein
MAGVKPLELIGSAGSPGILLIAYVLEMGGAFCIVEGTLYNAPMKSDGSIEQDEEGYMPTEIGDVQSFNWLEVVSMSDEENEELRPVITALGHDYEAIVNNMPTR